MQDQDGGSGVSSMVQVHSTNQGDPLNNASLWLAEPTQHLNGAILISVMACVLCSERKLHVHSIPRSCANSVECCMGWMGIF